MVANPPGIQVKRLPFVVEKERCISPGDTTGKESTCNVGDLGLIPGLGRSPGEGNRNPLQYSGLENSVDYVVHGIAKSQTRLSDFHFSLFLKVRLSPPSCYRECIGSHLQDQR